MTALTREAGVETSSFKGPLQVGRSRSPDKKTAARHCLPLSGG